MPRSARSRPVTTSTRNGPSAAPSRPASARPTLAEEFYTAVNVSPTLGHRAAAGQLAPPPRFWACGNLKPETSISYSVGIVAHPLDDLSASRWTPTAIAIGNRIVTSATVNSVRRLDQCAAGHSGRRAGRRRRSIPTATQQGVTAFLNGLSTLTQGVDFTVNYPTDFGDYGLVDWTLAGNYNDDRGLARGAGAGPDHQLRLRARPSSGPTRCSASSTARRLRRSA